MVHLVPNFHSTARVFEALAQIVVVESAKICKIKHIAKRNVLKTQNTCQNQVYFNFRLDFNSYSEFSRCSSSEYLLSCIFSNCRLALAVSQNLY